MSLAQRCSVWLSWDQKTSQQAKDSRVIVCWCIEPLAYVPRRDWFNDDTWARWGVSLVTCMRSLISNLCLWLSLAEYVFWPVTVICVNLWYMSVLRVCVYFKGTLVKVVQCDLWPTWACYLWLFMCTFPPVCKCMSRHNNRKLILFLSVNLRIDHPRV